MTSQRHVSLDDGAAVVGTGSPLPAHLDSYTDAPRPFRGRRERRRGKGTGMARCILLDTEPNERYCMLAVDLDGDGGLNYALQERSCINGNELDDGC